MHLQRDSRTLRIIEHELDTLMLHRMPMLRVPEHCPMLTVVAEALMSLVLMRFQVNVDVLHACNHHGLARPNRTSLC